ncbi:carbamoyl phosphate synthase small subunit [Planococcus maritimus]|uniref:Carbamoyl phosphate synthase small chain n=1 Tax=Planococcus maritimus TaxID=192421 RepID=A0A7D7MGW8_PLAMR|nr:carbamoyl phosphate synthase small subunit [Planococcus maritimus]QMT17531.1 carbamoyl phosphate synthase small subunit [Planococcus maritimus]
MTGNLILAAGESFTGTWHATQTAVQGELVFFTGMTGYEEVITDPSYKGQIIVFSYPLIGQYGIETLYAQSEKIQAAGIIVSELYEGPLPKQALSLAQFAKAQGVPLLSGIDTRSVIQQVREMGTMPAQLLPDNTPKEPWQLLKTDFFPAQQAVTAQQFGDGSLHIGLIDFHYKASILKELLALNCRVSIIPYDAAIELPENLEVDGLLFSNGPGDPKALNNWLPVYRTWAERYPSFGICLGHQVLAAAFGATTTKLAYGHRGANHPVKNNQTGRVSMSSQNHSYVVEADSLSNTPFEVLYENVNDGSIEGLIHPQLPITTVQFHPEAAPGPTDHLALFHQFLETVNDTKKVKMHA